MQVKGALAVLCLAFIILVQAVVLPVASSQGQNNGNILAAKPANSSPGVPLQPGNVVFINTWNSSLGSTFSQSAVSVSSQPLTPVNNCTIDEKIPLLLLQGSPVGSYSSQHYSFFSNGTFSASDGMNNTIGWAGLAGLPNGTLATSLRANSTEVVQTFVVTSGIVTLANVSIIYTMVHSQGYDSGLDIAIAGSASWGLKLKGTLGLEFAQKATSSTNSSVWSISCLNESAVLDSIFNLTTNGQQVSSSQTSDLTEQLASLAGTNLTSGIGFDWSDAAPSYQSTFDVKQNTIEWTVRSGSSFDIDPKIVVNSSDAKITAYDFQTKLISACGRQWLFFMNSTGNTGYPSYMSSTDLGGSWSAPSAIGTLSGLFDGSDIAVVNTGNSVYVAVAGVVGCDFQFGRGTMCANGTIIWSSWRATGSGYYAWSPSICVDSSGNAYVAVQTQELVGNAWQMTVEVYKLNAPDFSSCSQVYRYDNSYSYRGQILSGGGNSSAVALLLGVDSGWIACPIGAVVSTNGGATWSSPPAWTTSMCTNYSIPYADFCFALGNSQAVIVGSNVYVAASNCLGISLLTFNTTGGNWSGQLLDGSSTFAGISTDNSSAVDVYYGNSTMIFTRASFDLGKTWTPPAVISSAETGAQFITMCPLFIQNYAAGVWTSGISAPYSIRFAATPVIIPDAANSPNEWSKPGLSPYENYFTSESEYVSPGNGLLGIEQTDYSLAGRGLSLTITRVYSTPYAFTTAGPYMFDNYTAMNMGLGWSLSVPWFGQNYFHLWDGQVYTYNWNGSVFENHQGTDFKLVNNSGGSYDLYAASGTDYHFNASKTLVSITDATGNNTISIAYGSNGEISQMTDAVGRKVNFIYNANGQLTTMVTGEGNWTYSYSGSNLIAVTDPLNRVTKYQYSTGINSWLVSSVIYPTGAHTDYTYGSAVVGTEATTFYVTRQNIYSSAAALSRSTSFNFSIWNGQVLWCNSTISDGIAVNGYVSYDFTNPSGSVRTEYDQNRQIILAYESDYDAGGRINVTKVLSPSGAALANSSSQYDNWGNVVCSTDYNGHQAWFSYSNTNTSGSFPGASGFTNSFYNNTGINGNIHDLLLSSAQYQNGTGSARMETYFQYDKCGDLVQEKQLHNGGWIAVSSSYDKYGNLISATDPLNSTTYYQYSPTYGSAYLTSTSAIVGGQNLTTTCTYNFTNGAVLTSTDPMGCTTTYRYDKMGRVVSVSYPPVNGTSATKTYAYNDTGNFIVTTDEDGNSLKQVFDGLERLAQVVTYNGSAVYSTENYSYNWLGQVTSETIPSGSTYTYCHDSLGKPTLTINPDGSFTNATFDYVRNIQNVTDPDGCLTSYGYDWMGNLLWVREYLNGTAYYQTNYTYDQVGDLLKVTDPNGHVTSYVYDDLGRATVTKFPDGTNQTLFFDNAGNLLGKTDQMGRVTNYTYDSAGKLLQVKYPDKSTANYTYDKDGNLLSVIEPQTSTFCRYDAMNRLVNETDVINGTAYSTFYAYDKASNVISTTYPDGRVIIYSYDSLGRVSSVAGYANFTYTVDGGLSRIRYANNATTTYAYDKRDRPTRILTAVNGTTLMDLNYTYDFAGNVLKINNENYTYDKLERLASATGPWGISTYTYDPAGNLIKLQSGNSSTMFTYGVDNQLTKMGSANFTYDAAGDMLTKVNGSSTWGYGYDFEGRLANVTLNGKVVERNGYRSDGQRILATVNGSSVAYVYASGAEIFERNFTTRATTDYIYANGMDLAEVFNGTSTYYCHEDALGSVRLVTSGSLSVAFSSDYAPFGKAVNLTSAGQELMYTDKPLDSVTGLYYFGARFYDPSICRFISPDTLMGSTRDPMSLNRYVYARDNPEVLTDPNGHDWAGFCSALGSFGNEVWSGANSVWSYVDNAWNSIPPVDRDIIECGAMAAVTVLTCGAAAPLMLGIGVAAGLGSMGVYAGYEEATGGAVTAEGLADTFTMGFNIGTMAASVLPGSLLEEGGALAGKIGEDAQKGWEIGAKGEQRVIDAIGGVDARQVPVMTKLGGRIYDFQKGDIYGEIKTGFKTWSRYSSSPIRQELERDVQCLIENSGKKIMYLFESNPSTGEIGASQPYLDQLFNNGMRIVYMIK